jgi:hypothetical protein
MLSSISRFSAAQRQAVRCLCANVDVDVDGSVSTMNGSGTDPQNKIEANDGNTTLVM